MNDGPGYVTPQEWLSKAAEDLRAFNHQSTLVTPAGDWAYAPHAYTALGALSRLVMMLPQAVQQSTVPVTHALGLGRIVIDGGGDPAAKAAELYRAQHDAVVAAESLYRAVEAMHAATSPMGTDTRGLPEFEDDED